MTVRVSEIMFFVLTETKKSKVMEDEKPAILSGLYIFPNGDKYGNNHWIIYQ